MEKWRLFVALELPKGVRESLSELQSKLRKSGADVRWTRPEGIHLTLKFLGPVEPELVDPLAEAMIRAAQGAKAMSVEAAGIGGFPNLRRPRVIWAGLMGEVDPILDLQLALEREIGPMGFPPENRPFSPHLTLGRVNSPKGMNRLTECIEAGSAWTSGPFILDRLVLFRSILYPSGAAYSALREVGLLAEG